MVSQHTTAMAHVCNLQTTHVSTTYNPLNCEKVGGCENHVIRLEETAKLRLLLFIYTFNLMTNFKTFHKARTNDYKSKEKS